jgi:putative heme-binding domain-containing protein
MGRLLASPDESIRLEAVRTLGAGPLQPRFAMLGRIADDPRASMALRAWAIAGLADDASAQRERLLALSGSGQPPLRREAIRSLRGVSLTGAERTSLTDASRSDEESLALLKSLQSYTSRTPGQAGSPVDASLPPRTDVAAWLTRLEGPADAAAGERVFFHSKGPGCYRCHQVDGRGGRVGPDLSRLATGMDRRRLVQSILEPSLEIAPQFVAWSVARTDGTVFTGVLVGESPEGTLSFADADGRFLDVKPSGIEERKPQTTSIMPDNVAQTLTSQEFRDLVAFLLERRQ